MVVTILYSRFSLNSLFGFCFLLLFYCCRGFSIDAPTSNYQPPKPIPITVLSGFLGSGKTTLLQKLLNNKDGVRIAIIVNDVGSVNIDSKMLSQSMSSRSSDDGDSLAEGMVELQNGCACCSLADELLTSVSQLVTLNDLRGEGEGFDHIVIELSGVADPKGVRSTFQEAMMYNMPLLERVQLDTMTTLIDCSAFLDHIRNAKSVTPSEMPELFYKDGKGKEMEKLDYEESWAKDIPSELLEALRGDAVAGSDSSLGVAGLLVSQSETADIVVLNKIDLANDANNKQTLQQIEDIITAINPKATVVKCEYGNIPHTQILGVFGGRGVAEAGVIDDHRDAIDAAENQAAATVYGDSSSNSDVVEKVIDQESDDSNIHDESNSHSHSHNHHDDEVESTLDGTVTQDNIVCSDPDCDDHGHSHSHDHECSDPDCSDTSHSHPTKPQHAGIGSFVYRARKPFHPSRLAAFLRHLPISRGVPLKSQSGDDTTLNSESKEVKTGDNSDGINEPADDEVLSLPENFRELLSNCLRSKGFVWRADSDVAALYWSHAGSSFEMTCVGRWWATLPRPEWPEEAVSTILNDFDEREHVEKKEEDGIDFSVGDRRQEIVFIGPTLGDTNRQQRISDVLDQCLLNDSEFQTYREKRSDTNALTTAFENNVFTKFDSY